MCKSSLWQREWFPHQYFFTCWFYCDQKEDKNIMSSAGNDIMIYIYSTVFSRTANNEADEITGTFDPPDLTISL